MCKNANVYYHLMISPISFAFANDAICADGSDPIERIQISGVRGSDSSHVVSKLRICPSPYSAPRESAKIERFKFLYAI